ncbi:macrophage migration inhibitory factor-like [Ammospiza nelsoni]|uniref:macrophage migration inhibitory factor-like n=1 Tax=Ammospiza nelsoni TaxID=2857394 RepID=UPI0028698CB0|nr:macrophage migration inhibitory factor-like [Ammospiza nelsoni]
MHLLEKPKFIVNTNISKAKVPESFAGELTQQLSKALGKPAQYLAIQISPDQVMSFGGSTDPCAVCFLYSIGKTGEQENKGYCKLLCELMSKQLKTPSDRIYISFFDISAGNVGRNNSTFA